MIKIKIFKRGEKMRRPIIGIALGSGAAKGFAHIGVLKALEEKNIHIDVVAGCSAGALIGGLYCCDLTPLEIEVLACKVETRDWIDLTIPITGIIKGRKVEKMMRKFTKEKQVENLNKKFIAVATDLSNSEKYIFNNGPVSRAIRASIAIPGIFEPVIVNDMTLVDGAVVDRVPVSEIRKLDVDIVVGVDLGFTVLNKDKTNILDIIIQSVELLTEQAMKNKHLDADILIKPDLRSISPSRFDLVEEAIEIGYKATLKKIDEIKQKIRQYR